jgi:quercetin dioxygenase-like cupin family protein
MKAMALGSAAMGVGIGLAAVWAMRHALVHGGLAWMRRARWGLVARLTARFTARDTFSATSAYALDWTRNNGHQDHVTYFMKPLHHNARTGDSVILVRYPAGQMNPPHRHPVGHGLFVLQGTLVTHRGSFGRDTFVWFPPHEPMAHGAGPDEDLVALFTTSKDFRTEYLGAR